MNEKGFTLIELLVVVAIIGILAAVGVVAYSGYTSGAKKKTTIASYIHKWSNSDLFIFRMREILAMIIVYIIYYSQFMYLPEFLNDLHIVNKLKDIIEYLVDDFLGIFLKTE